jgi:hypothetical protein
MEGNMNHLLQSKVLMLVVCVILLAGVGFAGPCTMAPLSTYLSPFSCDIGDKTFSNFSWSPSSSGGAPPILASAVTVNPILPPPPYGFLFTFAGFAAANQTQDELLGYTVTAHGALITDASLTMFGAGFFGDGSVSIFEDLCSNDYWSDGCAHGTIMHLSTCLSSGCNKITDHIDFSGEQFIDVRKNIELNGGTNGSGSAFLSGVQELYSQGTTPEPSSILLFGGGALALAGVLRRKLNH